VARACPWVSTILLYILCSYYCSFMGRDWK